METAPFILINLHAHDIFFNLKIFLSPAESFQIKSYKKKKNLS